MDDRETLARTFDTSADVYDGARPGYPAALFDDLAALAGLAPEARLLEIGCGTGKATLPLARRGYAITCVEPGQRLAAVARRNLAAFPRVVVREGSFEAFTPDRPYDLVYAATSWDWLDPATKYSRAAAALRPATTSRGGCLAVFWNAHIVIPGDDRFWEVVQHVYERHAPQMVGEPPLASSLPTSIEPAARDAGFEEIAVRYYPWTEMYTTPRYMDVMRTFSGHIVLPADVRAALINDVGALIDGEFGGEIVKHWVSVLMMSRHAP